MVPNDADAPRHTPPRRRRSGFATMSRARWLVGLLVLVGVVAGCTSSVGSSSASNAQARADAAPAATIDEAGPEQAEQVDADPEELQQAAPEPATPEPATPEPATPEPAAPEPAAPEPTAAAPKSTTLAQEVAAVDTDLPPAPIGFDSLFENQPAGPLPVAMAIENIDVQDAAIIPVGVNEEDLSFEVPPADQVGWYEFGPTPGQPGSAVLAAHIAYNGVDGVFRYLESVEVGSIVVIDFDDGSSQRYRIEEVTEYVKEELPDSLFARSGREQLALITCGGTFNDQLDSYESNTVVIAVPIF